ncbi:uncharacterized protein [Anabrus simplex]|uniref:uncharacterized protein n=1 Tax=Anabrus simplex TaxID=316456 RepID=UPI0035A3C514
MDPKRVYAIKQTTSKQINAHIKTRIPPADQSDDSCLSDTVDNGDEYLPTSTGDVSSPDDDSHSSDSDTDNTTKNSNEVQTANSGTRNAGANIPVKRPILWKTVPASQSPKSEPTWNGSLPEGDCVPTPIEYFHTFFDDSILEHIVEQSNLFSMHYS